jgi:two-component system response regulator AtoC
VRPPPAQPATATHARLPAAAPVTGGGRRAARSAARAAILRALMRTGWNKRKAAKRLQISYKALLYKIKECEIVDPRNAAMIDDDLVLAPQVASAASPE